MSKIGVDITRSGLSVAALPASKFVEATWRKVTSSQTATSALSGVEQVNTLPGARWTVDAAFVQIPRQNAALGKIRSFLSNLEGPAGRFFMSDPTWCERLGVLGKAESATVSMTVPEITGNDSPLYPAEDLYPSETLYPSDRNYDAYTFAVSFSFDAIADLVVSEDALGGVKSVSVNPISVSTTSSTSNAWDYSNGVRPNYQTYYNSAMKALSRKIELEPTVLLYAGDYIQIEDALRMLTADFNEGDTSISFSPALIHPVDAGTVIEYETPGVIMRLVDDNQATWSAGSGLQNSIPFSAIEAIE